MLSAGNRRRGKRSSGHVASIEWLHAFIAYSPTASMEWRHWCEVKHVVRLRTEDREKAHAYLESIEARRGKQAAERLKTDAAALFQRGMHGSTKDT